MANALLQARRSAREETSSKEGRVTNTTHVNEGLKRQIVSHLVIDSVSSDWVVRDIFHICLPEVESSIEKRGGDRVDTRVLLSLDFMQVVHKLLVVLIKLGIVVEYIFNELVEAIARDDGGLSVAQS